MWTRKEIKETGKAAFKANYWKSVIVAFLLSVLAGGVYAGSSSQTSDLETTPESLQQSTQSMPLGVIALASSVVIIILLIALVLKIFFFNPLKVGCYAFFRTNVTNPAETKLDMILSGFSQYKRTFLTLFLSDLYVFLWCLLLIIPGIMRAYSYRLVPYILSDDPELSPKEVLRKSKEMMHGQRWKAFVLDLSFLGWEILGALTLGLVDLFWTKPYEQNADAALYLRLRGEI